MGDANREIVFDRRNSDGRRDCATLVCTRNPDTARFVNVLKSIRSDILSDIVVVDDGSDSFDHGALDGYIDVLIRIDRNIGVPRATNVGLIFAEDEGYSICFRNDDDDVTLAGRYQATLEAFSRDPDCVLVCGLSDDVTPEGKVVREYGRPGVIRKGNRKPVYPNTPARHSTFALNLGRLGGALRYDPDFRFGQDYNLVFSSVLLGNVIISDRKFIEYLTGPSTRSYRGRRQQLRHRLKNFMKHGDWRLPIHYASLALTVVSLATPEAMRPCAWRLFDAVSVRKRR